MKRNEIATVKGKCGVYKITCLANGKEYIGSSCNIYNRWTNHTVQSKWNRHPNNLLYSDMKTYGVDKFDFEIVYECCKPLLKILERKAIELHKPEYNQISAYQTDEERKQYQKQYYHQLCFYNGETLTLKALTMRFSRAGISHAFIEAKKYLLPDTISE